jgi:hypothetical protein
MVQRQTTEMLATASVIGLDPSRAAATLATLPRCDRSLSLNAIDMLVSVIRMGAEGVDAAAVARDIEATRASTVGGDRAMVDVIAARLRVAQKDSTGGRALAREAIAAASKLRSDDVSGRKAITGAHLTLAVAAAEAGRADEALDEIAEGAHASGAAAVPCSIGLAVDDDRFVVVTRDDHGSASAEVVKRAAVEIAPSSVVPSSSAARLASCDHIRVIAMAPLHGTPRLFPADVAWGYVSGPDRAAPTTSTSRRLVVSDVATPESLHLPALQSWGEPRDATWLHGEAATPANVMKAMRDATDIEIHAHGFVDGAQSAASILALSPGVDGHYALTAADLAGARLDGSPSVILGACHAARTARYFREAWSLPSAFVRAGARVVFASTEEIRDAEARPFFDAVRDRIRKGASPAIALRDERVRSGTKGRERWTDDVIVFE